MRKIGPRKKGQTTRRIMTGTTLVLSLGLIVTAHGYLSLRSQNRSMQEEMDRNKQYVYVATKNIEAGDTVLKGVNVTEQQIYTGLDSGVYMTDSEVGYRALVTIPAGVAVQDNMIGKTEISQDTRDYEISQVNLMTDQKDNDIVDIRIMFADGSDYTVVSKKTIKKLNLQNNIFHVDLTEDEMLCLASATIDAYQHKGAKLYTVRYVQPTVQELSVPYYPVRSNVADLLHNDPNIMNVVQQTLNTTARQDLEDRLGRISEDTENNIVNGNNVSMEARKQYFESAADAGSSDTSLPPETVEDSYSLTTETTASESEEETTGAAEESTSIITDPSQLPEETTAETTTEGSNG